MKEKVNPSGKSNGTIEIFVPVDGQADSAANPALAVQKFHSRLAGPEFVKQMTEIFFEAKRAALASSK